MVAIQVEGRSSQTIVQYLLDHEVCMGGLVKSEDDKLAKGQMVQGLPFCLLMSMHFILQAQGNHWRTAVGEVT